MPDQEKHDRSGSKLIALTILVFAAILAYLFWPADLSSLAAKMTAIGAAVIVVGAIVMAWLIW